MQRKNKQLPADWFTLRLDYEFLLELENILNDRQKINDAILGQAFLHQGGSTIDLDTYDQLKLLGPDGNQLDPLTPNMTIDVRVNNGDYVQGLPLHERIIVNAAVMQAQSNLNKKYQRSTAALIASSNMYDQLNNTASNQQYIEASSKKFGKIGVLQKMYERVMQKLPIIRMQDPLSFHPHEEAAASIENLKSQYRLQFLNKRLHTLLTDYQLLGRSKHTDNIKSLNRRIETIHIMGISDTEKISRIIKLLEDEFRKQMQSQINGLTFLSSIKTPNDFIKRINKNTNDYQYPRLLASILKNTYRDNSQFGDADLRKLMQKFSTDNSEHRDVYANKIADRLDDTRYVIFAENLKKSGLKNADIKKLYTDKIILDIKALRQLWPELNEYDIGDTALKKLLTADQTDITFPKELNNILGDLDSSTLQKSQKAAELQLALNEVSGHQMSPQRRDHMYENIDRKYSPEGVKNTLILIKDAIEAIKQRQTQLEIIPSNRITSRP